MRRTVVLTLATAFTAMILAAPAASWTWPADGQVIRAFSLGDDPYAGGQHRGVDIAGDSGSGVRAPAAGTVSFAGTVPGNGRTVTIRSADGYAVTLVGLGSIGVAKNAVVSEGETVGTIAAAPDDATPANVHLGIRIAAEPEGYIDPLTLLPTRVQQPAASDQQPAASDQVGEETVPAGAAQNVPAGAAQNVPATSDEAQSSSEPAETPASGGQAEGSTEADTAVASIEQLSQSRTPVMSQTVGTAAATIDSEDTTHEQLREHFSESSLSGGDAAPLQKAHARGSSSELGTIAAASTDRLKQHENVSTKRSSSASTGAGSPALARSHSVGSRWIGLSALLALLLGAAGGSVLVAVRVHGSRRSPRMMLSREGEAADDEREQETEDPGCSGLAVRQRPASHWARSRVRRPVGHLRSLPQAQRQRCPDGERHRRARDARHGRGRERRALIA